MNKDGSNESDMGAMRGVMRLYGHPHSGCTRKVLMALAEKGQEAELVLVDLASGEHQSGGHRALHPFAKVPVLDDDGFVLYESEAITRYLDARLPGRALTPAGARGRARMEQWSSVATSYLGAPVWVMMQQLALAPMFGGKPDMAKVAAARLSLGEILDVLEGALEAQAPSPRAAGYLAGRSFSLADISFMPALQLLEDVGQDDLVIARPFVAAWWRRVRARPAWLRVLAMAAPPAPAAAQRLAA
jgi:glutathione S-transferase